MYGADREPAALTFDHNELLNHLAYEAFYSHILNIDIEGRTEQAILKGLQRHPAKPRVLHIDLFRVSAGEEIRVNVPLHFTGAAEAIGVKRQGGEISHHLADVEIDCLPKDLPEYIEVDIAALELGESLHLSDLKLPEGVSLVELQYGEEHDQPVVSIHRPRVTEEEEPAEAAAEVPVAGEGEEPAEGEAGEEPEEGAE
jgi:large subunit ribosomal protein L25